MEQQLENKLRNMINSKYKFSYNTINSLLGDKGKVAGDTDLEALKNSALYRSYEKSVNTVTSDTLPDLVELISEAINAPTPATIGRSLINLHTTTSENLKIRLPRLAVASKTNNTKKGRSVGERNDFVTLTPNQEIEDSDQWNINDLEDRPWNLQQSDIAAIGVGHDIKETSNILDFYNNLPVDTLGTGALIPVNSANEFGWSDIVDMWVGMDNFNPNALVMNRKTYGLLIKDQDFKDQTILGEFVDLSTGVFGRTLLGFDIFVSTLQADNLVLGIDTSSAGQYALRRNKVLKTFQSSINDTQIQISSRFDLKLGRVGSVVRMNITLT